MARKIDPAAVMAPRAGDLPGTTRRLAALYRFQYYATRATCRNGHASVRLSSTGECVRCVSDRHHRWRTRHPEAALARTEAHLEALGKSAVADPSSG